MPGNASLGQILGCSKGTKAAQGTGVPKGDLSENQGIAGIGKSPIGSSTPTRITNPQLGGETTGADEKVKLKLNKNI